MLKSLKKIVLDDKKSAEQAKPEDRGKTEDVEKIREWLRKNEFTELPKEGQEAFFRYLCGDKYPEDKDICDIDPKAYGMNIKSRQYQFWLRCEKFELLKLFEDYILSGDDTRLPEVEECFHDGKNCGGEQDMGKFLSEKEKDAKNTDSFFEDLKSKMKQKLDTYFGQFKKDFHAYLNKKT